MILALAWSGFLVRMHLRGEGSVVDRIETAALDWRMIAAGPLAPPEGIAIVAIDDATVAAEGGYPLARGRLAQIVDTIGESGAKAIAIDVLLTGGEAGDRHDAALTKALAGLPSVIVAAASFDKTVSSIVPVAKEVLAPAPIFAASAKVGLVNVAADAGGTPRQMPLVIVTPQGPQPSMVLAAAGLGAKTPPSLAGESVRIGAATRRLDIGWHLPIRFYGPTGTIATVGAAGLVGGKADERLAGRLIFLGVTATAIGDSFTTPFDPRMPGVEVLATAAANLVDGTGLIRDGAVRRTDALAAVALTLLTVAAIALLPLPIALVLSLAALLAWLGATFVGVASGYWLAAMLAVAAVVPPAAFAAFLRLRRERLISRNLKATEAALRRLQPPALADHLARHPNYLTVPEERNVAVLFIDLAGFTGMSERLGAARSRDVLKEFHSLVVEELLPRGGVVLSFMGDGAMVVFGLPEPSPQDSTNAVRAGLGVIAAVRRWIAESRTETALQGVRLGAHYGPVVLSRLGHDDAQHITATGDSVNVASRLMEVGKAHHADIVISAALWEVADTAGVEPPDRWEVVPIRGRGEAMKVGFWQ
ncbi:CHASE2 domain-containing protein [Jiella avicenniae]|uniref:Adenylate/guanylate cyclase domain-containing protein n=1 Tax=Jiella avicenniae TaxID=2907202 RepID=A0A9X1P816_9HYPH|nr:adenylate/guanylate cyclase domain-containing protein [Jiella avicenniae]MCE7030906.1 adenylate/guanylate cyclase domain-containing protein [Jiella avicenniae]